MRIDISKITDVEDTTVEQIDNLAVFVRAQRDLERARRYGRPTTELERQAADAKAALPPVITVGV